MVVGFVLVALLAVAFYAASRPSDFVRLRAEVVELVDGVSFVDVVLGENVYALEAKFLSSDELVEFSDQPVSDPLPWETTTTTRAPTTTPQDPSTTSPSSSATDLVAPPTTEGSDLLPPTSPQGELKDVIVNRTGTLQGAYLAAFAASGVLEGPHQVRVVSVDPRSPLFEALPPGTVIEAVARLNPEGGVGLPPTEVSEASDVLAAIRSAAEGDRISLITSAGTVGAEISATPALGLTLEDYRVASATLDPDFLPASAVRPGAGLASGIAIVNELRGGKLLAGKNVVAVGLLSEDGSVVAPSRMPLRLKAIRPSDFDLVFLPSGTELPDSWRDATNVVMASSLSSAVQYLR